MIILPLEAALVSVSDIFFFSLFLFFFSVISFFVFPLSSWGCVFSLSVNIGFGTGCMNNIKSLLSENSL